MQTLLVLSILVPVVLIALVLWYVWLRIRYRTARSNEALVITGPRLGEGTDVFRDEEGRSMKIIRGGGYRLRRFQRSTPIDLKSFKLEIDTPIVITNGGVPIVANAIAMVKVADTLEGVARYAEQFLGKDQKQIENEISEVLSSNLRAILSKMTVEAINEDRESFNEQVTDVAQNQLDQMGFKITSLGLSDLRDGNEENGYLENLGRPRIAKVRKDAEIAEANTLRETRIHKAQTDQEIQEEEYSREQEIAAAKKEKDIQEARFKEETERARAKSEQSYELEKAKLDKEVKEEELNIQYMERTRAVELEEQENRVKQAKADADYYAVTKKAEGDANRVRIDGEASAKIKLEDGRAEAQVILERGKAEAEAREILAQAMDEHGDAILRERMIEMLPQLAAEFAKPLSSIDSVKVIDSGSGNGVSSVGGSVARSMMEMSEPLKETTGIDLKDLLSSFTDQTKKEEDKTDLSGVSEQKEKNEGEH